MIDIDDIIQSSIDPNVWKNLHPYKKIKILKLLQNIKDIIHSPHFS